MNWFKKFMAGRYGSDQLSTALLVLSILLTVIGDLAGMQLLVFFGYIPLVLGIYRIFSKDIAKRRMENYKFSIFISPVYSWFNKTVNRAKDSKTHKYYNCPKCNTKLRVPKGKGKLVITCPKCKTEIRKRT
jgi:hypothetical protein